MTATRLTRIVYGALGIIYVLLGIGSMLLPTGWLPEEFLREILSGEKSSPFMSHLLQEFGTLVIALGLVFVWCASRKEVNRALHWLLTFYFSLDALIHWVGADGLLDSWRRGIVNLIPFAVMFVLGVLLQRGARRSQ
jgi:hypothetical protein